MRVMKHANRTAIAVALLALAPVPAPAMPGPRERTADALVRVELEWLTALRQRDVGALDRILAKEFIDSDFQGHRVTRGRYLGFFATALTKPAPPLAQAFDDTDVRFVAGGEVAIVTGVVISKPDATAAAPTIRHSRFTDVFVWRGGRWQAVSAQETHFTPGNG